MRKQAISFDEIDDTEAFGGQYHGEQGTKDAAAGKWLAIAILSIVAAVGAAIYAKDRLAQLPGCHPNHQATEEAKPAAALNIMAPSKER